MRSTIIHGTNLPRPRPAHPWPRLAISERGASAIEFALIIPFLLMLTCGIIEMTNVFFVRSQINEIVRDTTRRVAVDALTMDQAHQYITDQLAGAAATGSEVTIVETEDEASATSDVTVSLNVPLRDLMIFDFAADALETGGAPPPQLSFSATMLKH